MSGDCRFPTDTKHDESRVLSIRIIHHSVRDITAAKNLTMRDGAVRRDPHGDKTEGVFYDRGNQSRSLFGGQWKHMNNVER